MEQLVLKIIMFIFIIIGVFFFVKSKEKEKFWIDHKFWLIFSWGVCLSLYFFSGIQYRINLTLISFFYILIALSLFCLGDFLIGKKDSLKIDVSKKLNTFPFFVFSVICLICYTCYMFHINEITIGVTRDFQSDWISTLFLIGNSVSLVIWLYELSYAIICNKNITWYGCIAFVLYNIPGILISGRDALIISLVVSIIVFFYSGYYAKKMKKNDCKVFKRLLFLGMLAIGGIFFYLVFLSMNRYGSSDSSALNMFEWSAQCVFPDYLNFIYYHLGGIGKVFINAVFYYSSQFSKFALIFEEYNGPYLFGFYQLHYISRLFPDNWPIYFGLVSDALYEITTKMQVPGLKGFWETALGYSIYDFGRLGTLLICFISGYGVGFLRNWCFKNQTLLHVILLCFICAGMFLTVELSPLFDYFYIFPLFWIFFLIIYLQFWSSKYEKVKK